MKTVYVAGAMNSGNILGVLTNVETGLRRGGELAEAGLAPFIPHLDIFLALKGFNLPMEFYYDYTMEFLTRCDCMFVCENSENSVGTKAEIVKATELGIPIYYSIEELVKIEGEIKCLN